MKPRSLSPSSTTSLTKSFQPHSLNAAVFFAACLAITASPELQAASATWNGTTNATWATDTNWSATPAPGAADTATFNNAGNANTTIDLGAGVSVGNIAFDTATAASYIIGSGGAGSQTLSLGGAGSISMAAAVINNQLINANLSLGTGAGAEAFTITNNKAAASNSLTLAGGVSTLLTGVKTVTIAGTGVTNVSGAINDGSGTLALSKTGAHVLTLSGSSNFSGGTLITGILVAGNSSALGTGAVTVNAAANNQLQLANGVNVANPLTLSGGGVTAQGVVYLPTGNATYSGTINASTQNAGGHFATAGYIDNTLTIAGNNTITSTIPITVRNGTVKITGSQSYTGGTSMNGASFIQFGKTTSMPASGSVVTLANGVIAANAGGAGEFTGGTGAGTIGGLTSGIGGQGAPVTWIANTTLGIDTSNAAGTVTHSAAFTPAVAVGLIKLGAGTLELTGGGTYASTGTIVGNMPLIARQGTLLLNGGTHTVTGEVGVGTTYGTAAGAAGYNAKLRVDSGTLNISSWLSVGKGNGIGGVSSDFEANNGAIITAANFSGGFNNGSALNLPKGTAILNNTASLTVTNAVNIAESAGSNFTLTLNGTSTFSQTANSAQTTVGQGANSIGQINVNGGTASFHRDLIIGGNAAGASGKLVLNSGTVHAATTVERWVIINAGSTSSGQIDLNGGNLNLNTNTDLRFSTVAASGGTNSVNMTGGSITGYTGNNNGILSGTSVLDMNQASTAATVNNTFNLAGGTLTIGQVISNNNAGTAAFNFNGGTLKAAANSANFVDLGGATQSVNVLGGGAIIDSNGNNVTVVDGLKAGAGSGGLTKLGAGNLTLSGTSTYIGATQVSAGTLTLAGAGSVETSASITVNGSGAKLVQANFLPISTPVTLANGSLDGVGTINTLTVASALGNTITSGNGAAGISPLTVGTLTFQGAATLNLQANGTNMERYINATDLLTPSTGTVINVTNVSGAWTSGTDYPLVNFSTYAPVDASHFTLGTVPGLNPNQTATLINTGSSIALHVTGESLVWTGSVNSNWTTVPVGGAKNWSYLGTGIEFSTNSPVLFDDTAALFSVNLAQNVSPSTVVFNNNTPNDYTLSSTGGFGILTGSLIKNGDGKVTITTTNSYTGSTIINAGILEIGDGTTNGSIATSSTITNNSSLIFNILGSPNVYANPITGTGSVTKKGTGALTLSGANTFTGNFTLDAGVLNFNSAGALGTGPGTIILNAGGIDNTSGVAVTSTSTKPQTWNVDVNFTGSSDLTMGTGAVALGGAGTTRTVTVGAGKLGTGPVTSTGYDLIKAGPGALRLAGGNSVINGIVNIQSGIIGSADDFFANGLIGSGTFENGTANSKWSFWTIATDQSSPTLIQNGAGAGLLGIVKRGAATWTLTNNANNATSNLTVDNGTLILNNTGTYGAGNPGGAVATNFTATIGNTAAGNALLEINGATVNYNTMSNADGQVFRSTLNIGNNATGTGSLRLSSGSLVTYRQLAVGSVNGASGAYRQTGGTTTVGGFLAIGLGTASGVFNQSGGTFTLSTAPVTNAAGTGSTGLMNLSGSAVFNLNGTVDNGLWVGEAGAGALNVSDSAAINFSATNNGLQLGRVAAGSGVVNLLGGNVTTPKVYKGAGAGTLNFNGGTLTANVAGTTFLTGLTAAYVHAGGGSINNSGNNITITQPLLAPTGNGVSAAGLNPSGTGFLSTPIVQVTGGDGTGATAVATINSSGDLTNITITNPGNGYTIEPTFTLLGGGIGNTGSITGTPALVANVGGGMAFSGAGITSLGGLNTYSGNSTVATGSTLALTDDATLRFVPKAPGVSNKVTGAGTAVFYGDFIIDVTGAAIANGNSWTLVDVAAKTYDINFFNIPGFTQASDVWTKVDGNNTWRFYETGVNAGKLTLEVTTPAGYNSWITGFGLPVGDQDPTDDPDNDGFKNLAEYVLNGNPSISDTSIAPTGVKSGSNYIFSFKRTDQSESDTTQFVEYGNDLTVWGNYTVGASPGVAPVSIVEDSPNAALDTVTVTIPTAGATKFFARLKVVK